MEIKKQGISVQKLKSAASLAQQNPCCLSFPSSVSAPRLSSCCQHSRPCNTSLNHPPPRPGLLLLPPLLLGCQEHPKLLDHLLMRFKRKHLPNQQSGALVPAPLPRPIPLTWDFPTGAPGKTGGGLQNDLVGTVQRFQYRSEPEVVCSIKTDMSLKK